MRAPTGFACLIFLTRLAMPAAAQAELQARDGEVEFEAHAVHATARGRIVDVVVHQTFRNVSPRPIEAVYTFPLPDGASVRAFSMNVGGKVMRGEVIEREKARRIYRSIVSRRKDPALLEKIARRTYKARVFPIPAGKTVVLTLTYSQILREDAGAIELRYPLGGNTPAKRVEIDLDFFGPAPVASISSSSHALDVESLGREARARVRLGPNDQESDLVVTAVRRASAGPEFVSHYPRVATGDGDVSGTMVALIHADGIAGKGADTASPVGKDVVYVLDTSGSMNGSKLDSAIAALNHGIARLRPRDRFAVLTFSTTVKRFRRGLVEATPENRETAAHWIRGREAAGGTALDEAIAEALALGDKSRFGLVVLLTDGLPSVGEQDLKRIIARTAKRNVTGQRLFVFGVGFDQNVDFLDRIATDSRGGREYVTRGENLEIVLSRFFRRIDHPVLTDLEIEADGLSELYPRRLPDLFAGDELVLFGRYAKPGSATLRLKAKLRGQPVAYELRTTLSDRADAPALPHLWAERKIDFLLEQVRLYGKKKELVDEVVRLGTAFSIVTPFTAGLVVEDDANDDMGVEPVEMEEVTEDSPFEGGRTSASGGSMSGPSTNTGIGLGRSAGGSTWRARSLRTGGGSRKHWTQLDRELDKLAAQAGKDGDFGSVEKTAVTALAFLRAGYTDRGSKRENRHAATVRRALRWLMTQQREDGRWSEGLRENALAALALAEAYWCTRNPRYRKPAQRGTVRAMALVPKTARDAAWLTWLGKTGKRAGLEVDPDRFEACATVIRAWKSPGDGAAVAARIMLFGAGTEVSAAEAAALLEGDWSDPETRHWSALALRLLSGKPRTAGRKRVQAQPASAAAPLTLIALAMTFEY